MIEIQYFSGAIAGKVYVIHQFDSTMYTVWRIANTSCSGSCRENREVVTFKSPSQTESYLTKLHIDTNNPQAIRVIDDWVDQVSNDSITLVQSEDYLFEGWASTIYHPEIQQMHKEYGIK